MIRTPKRIVVINDISVWRGGATGVALSTAIGLRDRGYDVTFITGDDAADTPLAGQGIDVVPIASAHIMDGPRGAAMLRGLYNRQAARFLRRWIAGNDGPDTVYHLHGWSKILSPAIFQALQPVSARLVLHAHDFFLTCPNGGYFDFRRGEICSLRPLSAACLGRNCDRRSYSHKAWRAARLGLRRMMLAPDAVGRLLVVHDAMIPLFERGGFARNAIGVLRNPVMPWLDRRIPAEMNSTFLFVGRLDEDKGVDLLASAARQAGVRLRMIGAGPLGDRLAQRFPEIEFSGWCTREQLTELCRDARAIVMPTRSRETFGIAGLEALMSGLPLIISSNAMLAPEIESRGFGRCCDPHDRSALADLLASFAGDDAWVSEMSRAAFSRARTLAPDPEQWVDEVIAHYTGLLDSADRAVVSKSDSVQHAAAQTIQ